MKKRADEKGSEPIGVRLGLAQLPEKYRRSFLGKLLSPLFEERRTLAGIMTWVGLFIFLGFIVLAIFAPIIAPFDPTTFVSSPNLPPSSEHLMGTDRFGRDVFSRVIFGARTSLSIMAIATSIALLIGLPLGLISGYAGGYLDRTQVMIMDSIYSFPGLLLALSIATMIGKGIFNISIAITVIYIPLYFRVIRNHVLSVKQEAYVEAARALGAKPWTVIMSYIAYNVIVSIPVIFSINAADAVLTAAGLSFLGFGLEEPIPDWGLDLSTGRRFLYSGVWWTSFFPGLMIVILTASLSMLGEGLNDIINPLVKKERS